MTTLITLPAHPSFETEILRLGRSGGLPLLEQRQGLCACVMHTVFLLSALREMLSYVFPMGHVDAKTIPFAPFSPDPCEC